MDEAAPIQISIDQVPIDDNDFIQNVLEEVYKNEPSNEVIAFEPHPVEEYVEYENTAGETNFEDTTPFVFITVPTTTLRSVEVQETETTKDNTNTLEHNIVLELIQIDSNTVLNNFCDLLNENLMSTNRKKKKFKKQKSVKNHDRE